MMKNFKVFASTVMAGITLGSSTISASAATATDEHKSGESEQSILSVYDAKQDYDINKPIEIMIPTGVKVYRDGSHKYEYSTVIMEFDKKSINPTELTQIIEGASMLNDATNKNEFVYSDANVVSYRNFKTNIQTINLTKSELLSYINKQNQKIENNRKKIDHSTYAEFMLPILSNYYYRNSKKQLCIYRKVDYIYFYVPYTELSNKTDFSNISEKVYEHYQNTLEHIITYNEIKNVKTKTK